MQRFRSFLIPSSSSFFFANLNIILVVVELVLLAPTLLLLILGRKEQKGRQRLLEQMTNTAKVLTRQEYFNSVEFAMRSATMSIIGSITGSSPKSADQEESVQKIAELIHHLRKKMSSNNIRGEGALADPILIRYLMPKSQNRLSVAYRYREAGADVRFHPGLLVSDLRYVIVDNKVTVLGLPSATGENQPTKEGYAIPSEALSAVFTQEFSSKWSQAIDYDFYAREVLEEISSHNHSVSARLLAAELLIPEQEIKRILKSLNDQREDEKQSLVAM